MQGKIIEGWYKGTKIKNNLSKNLFFFTTSNKDFVLLTKEYINKYEVITEDSVKSASSAILRGLIGTVALGGVGLLAGLSAKNKNTYIVAIEFKNGEKSLIEIDSIDYKALVKCNF